MTLNHLNTHRDYMTARRVSKEYEVFTRGINKSMPSVSQSYYRVSRHILNLRTFS